MKSLISILGRPLFSDRQDATLAQWACFAAAVAVIPLGLRGAVRLTDTNGELLIAVLATLILSVQLLLLGLVGPRAIHRS